jgi:uncharacterized protein Usg
MGYRLTLAEIEISDVDLSGQRTIYWQDIDHAPDFPVLSSFLEQWRAENRKSTLCSVKVATYDGVLPEDLSRAQISLSVH